MDRIPGIALNDGNTIPQFGFGVWQVPDAEVTAAVLTAIEAGYRAIDTAQGYDNERGVGRAIRESGLEREALFITSKLRTRHQGYESTLKSFAETLERLGLDYLDLFLIHWPIPAHELYRDTWRAFVQLQREGKVRSIGVSNFLPEHLEAIIADSGVVPAVNQIELHPYFQQRDVRALHERHRIAIESYSPLGSGKGLLEDAVIAEVAGKHGKSPAQAVLRWHIQQGLIVIPKSVHAGRIKENIDVFDFELDAGDMARIDGLDREDGRTNGDPATHNSLW